MIFVHEVYRPYTIALFLALLSSAYLAATEHWRSSTLHFSPCSAIRACLTASLCHLDWLWSLSCSVAWFQFLKPLRTHAPFDIWLYFSYLLTYLVKQSFIWTIIVYPWILLFPVPSVAKFGFVSLSLLIWAFVRNGLFKVAGDVCSAVSIWGVSSSLSSVSLVELDTLLGSNVLAKRSSLGPFYS